MTLKEQMHKRRDERASQAETALKQKTLAKVLSERERGRRESLKQTEARLLAMVEAGEPETDEERERREAKTAKANATRKANLLREETEDKRETQYLVTAQARQVRHAKHAQETEAETLARKAVTRERNARRTTTGLKPQSLQKNLVRRDKRLGLKLRKTTKAKQESGSLAIHKELQQQENTIRGEITLVRTQLRLLNGEA